MGGSGAGRLNRRGIIHVSYDLTKKNPAKHYLKEEECDPISSENFVNILCALIVFKTLPQYSTIQLDPVWSDRLNTARYYIV